MMITKRQPYFVAKSLEAANLGTIDYETYEETEGGKKSIMISYEPSAECAAIISNAFKTRGLKRESKPVVVSSEVKAESVKAEVESKTEEIKEESTMSEVIFTAAQVAALLAATSTNASKIVYRDREVVPADYEQLKRDLETARKSSATWQSKAADLEKQIAELKAQIGASVQTVAATSFVAETSVAAPAAPDPVVNPAPVANPVLEEMEKKAAEFAANKKREKDEEKACEAILKKAGFDGLSINRLHKRTLPEAAFIAVCKSFGAEKTAEACLYVVRNENGEFEPATLDLFERFSILPF